MKNDVLEFLASDGKNPQQKFNKALELYRKSKNHDNSQVRFMNSLGYSPARLDDLIYELKKLHGITDLELATEKNKSPLAPKGGTKVSDVARSIALVFNSLNAVNLEEMELNQLVETESIIAEELKIIPENEMPEDLSNKVKEFYEVLNRKHFEKEFNTLRENMEGMNDEDLFAELKRLPEERMPEDLSKKFNELKKQPETSTDDKKSEKVVSKKDPSTPLRVTNDKKEETPEAQEKEEKKPEENKKELDAEAIKKLDGFDVEAEDYNTVKSFAAELGDAIGKTPKDQKGATLKAFISDAKKKHSKA